MFRPYYQLARQCSLEPLLIDEMELWQLGATFEPTEEELKQAAKNNGGQPLHSRGRRNLVAERIAHAEGQGPKPEPDPPSKDQEMFFMQAEQLGVPVNRGD